jgi:cob(I)alamin adenosyltransferase
MPAQEQRMSDSAQARHQTKMRKQKAKIDAHIKAANTERGVAVLLTGNGKGKTSSALGMVMRALGYDQQVAVVQFIKGAQASGEAHFLRAHCPQVLFHQMGTGFTWDTQDKAADIVAAKASWQVAEQHLSNTDIDLVVLDELTYMLGYDYLEKEQVIAAIKNRPREQSVVVTGRGGGRALRAVMDTVSEVKEVQHAYRQGIKARKGVDY